MKSSVFCLYHDIGMLHNFLFLFLSDTGLHNFSLLSLLFFFLFQVGILTQSTLALARAIKSQQTFFSFFLFTVFFLSILYKTGNL